jgi:hypothetical protein
VDILDDFWAFLEQEVLDVLEDALKGEQGVADSC